MSPFMIDKSTRTHVLVEYLSWSMAPPAETSLEPPKPADYSSPMPTRGPDLISRRTRSAFRALATDISKSALAEYWQAEQFVAVDNPLTQETSVRRRRFDEYADHVDWSDAGQVERALRVFEHMLRFFHREPNFDGEVFADVREYLADDGLRLDERYKIHWLQPRGLEASLNNLTEASGIRAEIVRVQKALPDDPAGAIGAAKQLIEATAKVVLTERQEPFDDKADVPELVKRAQQALKLHPSTLTTTDPSVDGADALKKILGGVSAIAIGIAEFRNKHGSGHGQVRTPAGLGVRHAHLAVNAAVTWCQLLLDTLADPAAPWRKDAKAASGT